MNPANDSFEQSVFVNCPFDHQYKPLLQALLFALLYCGFSPRIANERGDASEVRVSKILEIIKECRYGIHDLSRSEPLNAGDFPRFNMPFELGLDIGCKESASGHLARKALLIFEAEPFITKRVLSDLSGNDCEHHRGEPEELVRRVRNWLVLNVHLDCPSGTEVWDAYNKFCDLFESETSRRGFTARDRDEMPIPERIYFMNSLLDSVRPKKPRRGRGN